MAAGAMASVAAALSPQWLGEIRQCSVVFVNFSGIDYLVWRCGLNRLNPGRPRLISELETIL